MIKLFQRNQPDLNVIGKHTTFIAAYYLYEIGMLYAYTGKIVYFWDALIHLIINLCFFYFNAYVVLPQAANRPGRLQAFLYGIVLLSIEFLVFLTTKYLVNKFLPEIGMPTTRPFQNWETFLRDMVWRFIYLSGLSTAYWLSLSSAEKQRRLANLEQIRLREMAQQEIVKQDLLATENAFLKAQINSHFLFNTLNYLHASVHNLNEQVGQTILDLSSILRYSFNTTACGMVSLSDELDHISHIFNITSIKASKPAQIQFIVNGSAENLKIMPLILVTLAENMLKYADLYASANPAKFICEITDKRLRIYVCNKKRKASSPFSSGIGMKNLEKRLNLAYQDNFTLDVVNSASEYMLTLIISLDDATQNNNC